MNRVIKKQLDGKSPGKDLRGRHKAAQKISEEQKNLVIERLNLFPAYQGYYSRHDNTDRKYLDPALNQRKMYILYKEWCKKKKTIRICKGVFLPIYFQLPIQFAFPCCQT